MNAYIDVRAPYPTYVSGLRAYSLEEMCRVMNIPSTQYRQVTVEQAEIWLFTKGLIEIVF